MAEASAFWALMLAHSLSASNSSALLHPTTHLYPRLLPRGGGGPHACWGGRWEEARGGGEGVMLQLHP